MFFREITLADFVFSTDKINILKIEKNENLKTLNDAGTLATDVIFSLTTDTGLDYLKWTELVRTIYYSENIINKWFYGELI